MFDPALIDEAALSKLLAADPAEVSVPLPGVAGRAGVRLIEQDGKRWVWRHNRRGGWCGRLIRNSYFWLGEARTRTFREWHMLDRMHRSGLPVPAPVAAIYRRRRFTYECSLITVYVQGTISLGTHLTGGSVSDDMWSAVGDCITRFHERGVCHADLNAHNVLIGPGNRVYLVDFDRGTFRQPGSWMQSNWARLQRSVDKLTGVSPSDSLLPAIRLGSKLQQRLVLWAGLVLLPF